MTQVRIVIDVAVCPDESPAAPQTMQPAIEDRRSGSRETSKAAKPEASLNAGSRCAVLTGVGDNNTIVINLVMPVIYSNGRNSSGATES